MCLAVVCMEAGFSQMLSHICIVIVSGGKNNTNGCHLAIFSVDVALAQAASAVACQMSAIAWVVFKFTTQLADECGHRFSCFV